METLCPVICYAIKPVSPCTIAHPVLPWAVDVAVVHLEKVF